MADVPVADVKLSSGFFEQARGRALSEFVCVTLFATDTTVWKGILCWR